MNSKGKVSTLAVTSKAVLGLPLPAQNLNQSPREELYHQQVYR